LRRRRRRSDQRRTRFRTPIRLIEHRPLVALERGRVGDWEGDLIVGRSSRSAIGTLVERRSRYLRLIHLPRGHSAEQLLEALNAVLDTIPAAALRTLTWDQGSEMAHHDQLGGRFDEGVFFAHPASPWMRPTNENTNGLLRQYFPKGSDLTIHEPDILRMVEERLNNRPRKTLGWVTPTEIFNQAVAS
jgi:IS30 family transposase